MGCAPCAAWSPSSTCPGGPGGCSRTPPGSGSATGSPTVSRAAPAWRAPRDGTAARIGRADRLRAQVGCELALYVGDDGTDERAFAAGPAVVGVRVGSPGNSAARFYLRGQEEIDDLLESLVALRARKTIPPERRRR